MKRQSLEDINGEIELAFNNALVAEYANFKEQYPEGVPPASRRLTNGTIISIENKAMRSMSDLHFAVTFHGMQWLHTRQRSLNSGWIELKVLNGVSHDSKFKLSCYTAGQKRFLREQDSFGSKGWLCIRINALMVLMPHNHYELWEGRPIKKMLTEGLFNGTLKVWDDWPSPKDFYAALTQEY